MPGVRLSFAMDAFKSHLASVADYPYTKNDARVKLDQNESPSDLPAEVKSRALERLARVDWNRYPELHAEDVRAALARYEDWPEEGVVIAPGSNLLVLALAQAARRVLDTVPAFPYYRGASVASGTPWQGIPLESDFALPRSKLLLALEGPPGVLFLPNPHAPTGKLFPTSEVEEIVLRAGERGWLVIVDEAYHQFAGTDARPLARKHPHVAILRTFSKAWSLGGIRAGYLLASARVASVARALIPPFCIPAHTGAILLSALESPGYVSSVVGSVQRERERVFQALSAHPTYRPYPSAANFILVRTRDAAAAFQGLLTSGILVRRQDHYPGLEGCVRISIGSQKENDALLKALASLS